jgi:hypothetical protein
MSQRIGTVVTAPVRINDDTIPYPIAYQEEIQGGAHSGPTLADRDGLAVWHRAWGMTFRVYNGGADNGNYVLQYGLASVNLADNGNWVLDSSNSGPSNVTKLDVNALNNGQLSLPAKCILYMLMVNALGPMGAFAIGYTAAGDELVMRQPIGIGYNTFSKGIWIASATTIYFQGVNPQSICSAIIFKF